MASAYPTADDLVISWIVASHNPGIFEANLRPTLPADDELVLVENAPSIAVAYNEGQARSTYGIRCYIHHDVMITDQAVLRRRLLDACTPDVGIVGVVGSRTDTWPWWNGPKLGSVLDSRLGLLDFGPGGECAVLDGVLLATAQDIDWDETYPGWHGYDHDACAQMRARGLINCCLSGGHNLVRHNANSSTNTNQVDGWFAAEQRYFQKWGS